MITALIGIISVLGMIISYFMGKGRGLTEGEPIPYYRSEDITCAYSQGLTEGKAQGKEEIADQMQTLKETSWEQGFNAGFEEAMDDK